MSTQNKNVYQISKLPLSNICVAFEKKSRLHTLRFIMSRNLFETNRRESLETR
jgi:hypothetical protein